jgi:hypothetical protein
MQEIKTVILLLDSVLDIKNIKAETASKTALAV